MKKIINKIALVSTFALMSFNNSTNSNMIVERLEPTNCLTIAIQSAENWQDAFGINDMTFEQQWGLIDYFKAICEG